MDAWCKAMGAYALVGANLLLLVLDLVQRCSPPAVL